MKRPIQIFSAPSILGLKPNGVELLSECLLNYGLAERLESTFPVIEVPTLNHCYSLIRDEKTNCLNPASLLDFSSVISERIGKELQHQKFPLVLGGDCTILLGIIAALKKEGEFGLLYLDAHADFYQPSKSPTGEVADMALAIVTGNGPEVVTDIQGLKPYVKPENVIHIGQRDAEETKEYDSQNIKDSTIKCFDLKMIREAGLFKVVEEVMATMAGIDAKGFWLHFDTDVINDKENPAVDYRLPGGLTFEETEKLLIRLLSTDKVVGMSVTIFNPQLDSDGEIAERITACLTCVLNMFPS